MASWNFAFMSTGLRHGIVLAITLGESYGAAISKSRSMRNSFTLRAQPSYW